MILDHLDNADRYVRTHPRLATAFAVLRRADLAALPEGRNEVDGADLYVMVAKAKGRAPSQAPLEVHDKYIDIHYVVAGEDALGWKARAHLGQPRAPMDNDVVFFDEAPEATALLTPGLFAVCFPEDGHRPMVSDGELHKIVVKIAL